MKNSIFLGLLWVLLLTLCPSMALKASSSGSGHLSWTTNYQEALQRSKKEGKPVLLFFTGSDWCGWCTRLEREVLHTIEFSETAKDQYIFVEVDFPKRKTIAADLKVQNDQLQSKHGIKSFPTIVLVDGDGNSFAETGYKAGGAYAYAAHLSDLVRPHLSKFSQVPVPQEKMALEMSNN